MNKASIDFYFCGLVYLSRKNLSLNFSGGLPHITRFHGRTLPRPMSSVSGILLCCQEFIWNILFSLHPALTHLKCGSFPVNTQQANNPKGEDPETMISLPGFRRGVGYNSATCKAWSTRQPDPFLWPSRAAPEAPLLCQELFPPSSPTGGAVSEMELSTGGQAWPPSHFSATAVVDIFSHVEDFKYKYKCAFNVLTLPPSHPPPLGQWHLLSKLEIRTYKGLPSFTSSLKVSSPETRPEGWTLWEKQLPKFPFTYHKQSFEMWVLCA